MPLTEDAAKFKNFLDEQYPSGGPARSAADCLDLFLKPMQTEDPYALSMALYISSILVYKSQDLHRFHHEYIIAEIRHCNCVSDTHYITINRVGGAREPSSTTEGPSDSNMLKTSLPPSTISHYELKRGSSSKNVADDVVANDFIKHTTTSILNPNDKLVGWIHFPPPSTSPDPSLFLYELLAIISGVHHSKHTYILLETNCFWFVHMILDITASVKGLVLDQLEGEIDLGNLNTGGARAVYTRAMGRVKNFSVVGAIPTQEDINRTTMDVRDRISSFVSVCDRKRRQLQEVELYREEVKSQQEEIHELKGRISELEQRGGN